MCSGKFHWPVVGGCRISMSARQTCKPDQGRIILCSNSSCPGSIGALARIKEQVKEYTKGGILIKYIT